jgi:large subunit ribosomal protein L6
MTMTRQFKITEEVEVPKGTNADFKNSVLTIKAAKGTVSRKFFHPRVSMTLRGSKITIETANASKRERSLVGTWVAHARNMIHGVNTPYVYAMKAVYAHFPIKMTLKDKEFIIENFLGERHPRKAIILGETKITVKGQELVLEGPNLEEVSQTAANIENTTRVRDRDPRVFQDGIFITSKGE